MLPQELFLQAIYRERKRTERSGVGFALMLLDVTKLLKSNDANVALNEVLFAVDSSCSEIDTHGWFRDGSIIGAIFTELGSGADQASVADVLLTRVTKAMAAALPLSRFAAIGVSFRIFPEDWHDSCFYQTSTGRWPRLAKRSLDVVGGSLALLFSLPLFAGIAIAIKLTSKGPVFFCQQRMGLHGRKFNFLKFRSMHDGNDQTIHEQFVKKFIANQDDGTETVDGEVRL